MSQERFEVGKMPHIEITECHGDLVVRSWAETAVLIKGDECDIHETEAGLSLIVHGSVKLTVPAASSLAIGDVHGDFTVKKLDGDVSLQNVMRDAVLQNIRSAKVGTVHGDFVVKKMDGGLSLETVMGDAAVNYCNEAAIGTIHGDLAARNIEGNVDIVAVMGDISLREVSGNVTVKQGSRDANLRGLRGDSNHLSDIAGDIRLRGPLSPGQHQFRANGDIVLYWPENEAVVITAVTPAKFTSRIQLDELIEQENGPYTARIGSGGPTITLEADGRIILKEKESEKTAWPGGNMDFDFGADFDFDFEDFSQKLNNEVFAHVNRFTSDLESKFGPDFAETISEKITRKTEQAAEQAMRQAEKAMRQAEQAMHQAERRMKQHRPPAPPRAPAAPAAIKFKPRVSSEEQLKILKMVEKGIISPEEASTLLEALEN